MPIDWPESRLIYSVAGFLSTIEPTALLFHLRGKELTMRHQRSGMTVRTKAFALLTGIALATSSLVSANVSAQETFPNKPINITVTFPPGGGTDILARLIGNFMSETMGHAAVVENKPGASGNVGAKYLADRAPDGYSLLMVNSSFAINPAVFSKMPFDPKKDFVPIVNMAWIPSVLVVPANSPYKNLAELLSAAKPEKNEVSYGSCGNGTPQHLAGASLNIYAKTHITHIPLWWLWSCTERCTGRTNPPGNHHCLKRDGANQSRQATRLGCYVA
jgi:hypothetical protein